MFFLVLSLPTFLLEHPIRIFSCTVLPQSLTSGNTVCKRHRLQSKLPFCLLSEVVWIILPRASLCSHLPLPDLSEQLTSSQHLLSIHPTGLCQAVFAQGNLYPPLCKTWGERSNWQQRTVGSSTHTHAHTHTHTHPTQSLRQNKSPRQLSTSINLWKAEKPSFS